jgi:ubiquinone/menaquinone biosynthesis C-methylase UbiE
MNINLSYLFNVVGPGRNLLLYPMTPEVVRVTATDASPAMLDVARTKLLEHGTVAPVYTKHVS